MPKQKDMKRIVRARMKKTGESYTTARKRILEREPGKGASSLPPVEGDLAELAGMSDGAVEAKTGRNWKGWLGVLDRAGAHALEHAAIARHLREVEGVSAWWAQTVTVAYERFRGLRDKGQRRGGGYDVNKSKTVPVPLERLYAAFGARERKRWMPERTPRVKKATRGKSMRLTWDDGHPVELYFWPKGESKSQVQIQHRELPSKAAADRVRVEWTERVAALAAYLR